MNDTLAVLMIDGYKAGHPDQYPEDTTVVYSNFTPRYSYDKTGDGVVFFGLQAFTMKYLVRMFEEFFKTPRQEVERIYSECMNSYLGPDAVKLTRRILELHDLGYLPLEVKALPEGTFVPYGVPVLTIKNTHPKFFWVTNMIETILSAELWHPCTTATSARHFRKVFETYHARTVGGDNSFVMWQGHDFSMRGLSGLNAAQASGGAHLLSFWGSDTIPAIYWLKKYYYATGNDTIIAGSVPATEHSVMCAGGEASERETVRRLICDVYPSGSISIVSDTWDYWNLLTNILPSLKNEIMSRDGKLISRPDSGTPEKIVCGDPDAPVGSPAWKGTIRLLDETFGHTLTEQGYKQLDSHVGVIYGDGITRARQEAILSTLETMGYASSNIVLGIGSFNYQMVTRDTHGFAMKATYVERGGVGMPIFKKPKTDDGSKNSAKGLLAVHRVNGKPTLRENVTEHVESSNYNLLRTVFLDGIPHNIMTFSEIRHIVESELNLNWK